MTSTMLGAQLLAKGKFIGCVVVRMPCDVEVDMYTITGMFSIAMTALASSPSFQRIFIYKTVRFWHNARHGAAVVEQ